LPQKFSRPAHCEEYRYWLPRKIDSEGDLLPALTQHGAGDILGGEQSGFIADIGFETYQKILDKAIQELRELKFRAILQNADANIDEAIPADFRFVTDCHI
jgi:hypothetical protein